MKNYKYMKSKVIINDFSELTEKLVVDDKITLNKRLWGFFAVIILLTTSFYLK